MTDTPNLGLPLIEAAQAQKHVTHNEALGVLDALVQLSVISRALSAPPSTPAEGDRYIVKATGTGAFAGKNNQIALFSGGGWLFYPPHTGWLGYDADEGILVAWNGSAWVSAVTSGLTSLQNLALLGVGTTADSTNPFSAKLNNALLVGKTVAEGGDGTLRFKLSKESATKTLSVLFQDNFSGRAEIGLTGDDDFHFKVSPDGSTWIEGLKIAAASGQVSFPAGVVGARERLTAARTYYVRTDGSDSNDGRSNSAGGAFLTIQKAIDTVADKIDLNGFDVTIQVADGTYTAGLIVYANWIGRGNVTLVGNTTTPSNCVISPSSGGAIQVGQNLASTSANATARLVLGGFKITTTNAAAVLVAEASSAVINAAMEYGNVGTGAHIQSARRSNIAITANYTISGNAAEHFFVRNSAALYCTSRTITLSGSPVFSDAFASVSRLGGLIANGCTFSGSTGSSSKRYATVTGGMIDTAGGGASYFPGDTAGTNDGTGIYV